MIWDDLRIAWHPQLLLGISSLTIGQRWHTSNVGSCLGGVVIPKGWRHLCRTSRNTSRHLDGNGTLRWQFDRYQIWPWQAAWQSNRLQHVGPEQFESWEKLTQTQKQVVFSWLSCFKLFPYFLFCRSTRNLQQLIETVKVRVQELARQIHHNDLQLERLNLEKKEAQHGRAIKQRHIFLGSWPVLTYFLTGDFGHLCSAE